MGQWVIWGFAKQQVYVELLYQWQNMGKVQIFQM